MLKKVLFPWPTDTALVEAIADAQVDLHTLQQLAEVDVSPVPSEAEWFHRSHDVDVISQPRIPFARYPAFLAQAKKLKMIQAVSIGYNNIDVDACSRHGVLVCNIAEIMAESVAQHAWALILDVAKHVSKSDRSIRAGRWTRHMGIELFGKTLGLIGLGAIGGRIAMKGAAAFGMRVLAYDPYLLPARAQLYHAMLVDLPTVLQAADVLAITCPLTSATHHLLQAAQLALLKPTAILVNTARGSIIDESALITALTRRQFYGAGLDVFENEPLRSDHPLRQLDNVVLTAHLGSSTTTAKLMTWKGAIQNIIRFLQGDQLHWIIDPHIFR